LLLIPAAFVLAAFQARSTAQLALLLLDSSSLASHSVPAGWMVKVTHGKPDVAAAQDEGGAVLRLRSDRASFGLERGVDVDLAELPYLTWRWKVTALPPGADFRSARTDDQAAQILVAFADRRVLAYLWDTSAPKGLSQSASSIPLVHIWAVVCRSGAAELNQWVNEARDVAGDYRRAYGRLAPRVKGLRLQINSQHTGTVAESYFGQVSFRTTPQ
jgi:Protein of unknown function (DUF3047)